MKEKLLNARAEISKIDSQIAELFEMRMSAVKKVAEFKQEHGLPVLDESREAMLLEKNSALITDKNLLDYYLLFQKNVMDVSKLYQRRLIEGMRVAYSGTEGAFAHIAAERIFPNTVKVSYPDFAKAYAAVETGECDCAVLPLENSYAGEVGQVLDLLFLGSLHISGIYEMPIVQNLLGVPGSDKNSIKRVISHPQALSQCAGYLHEHGYEMSEYSNTALAAKHVAEMGDTSVAAIASEETGKLFGLEIIERNINESFTNTTRFAVLTRANVLASESFTSDHFILLFTVRNCAGALAKAIDVVGQYGYNLCTIKSRPAKEQMWEYYFYLEIEGNLCTENGGKMLDSLNEYCGNLKVIGTFSGNCHLEEKEQ